MAGHKNQKVKDKASKRKREVDEAGTKSKRHRKETTANGVDPRKERAEYSNEPQDEAPGTSEAVNGGTMTSRPRIDLAAQAESETGWRISKPMGGRMLDIDPILTDNGQ